MVYGVSTSLADATTIAIFITHVHKGVTRFDGAQGKKKVWRPHDRTWSLLEELCWIEVLVRLLVFFGAPLQWFRAWEIVCPPRYTFDYAVLGWNLAQQLMSGVTPVVIKQTSEKRLLLLIQVWLSVLIKYDTGLTIALEVDGKSLDVESHSLMSVNMQKGTSPSYFLRNPTFSIISTTERPLPSLHASKYRWRNTFWNS